MKMDETLADISDEVKNFAVIYLVDITEVPDFVSEVGADSEAFSGDARP